MAFRIGSSVLPDFLDFFFFFFFFSVAAAESSGIMLSMQVGDVRPDCVRGVDSSETKLVVVVSVSGEEGVFVAESKRTTMVLKLESGMAIVRDSDDKQARGWYFLSTEMVVATYQEIREFQYCMQTNFPRFEIQRQQTRSLLGPCATSVTYASYIAITYR